MEKIKSLFLILFELFLFTPEHSFSKNELLMTQSGSIYQIDSILCWRKITRQEIGTSFICLLHDTAAFISFNHQFTAKEGSAILNEFCLSNRTGHAISSHILGLRLIQR